MTCRTWVIEVRADKVRSLRLQRYFWLVNIPCVLLVYFALPGLYAKASVLYMILLSLLTQVNNIEGAEQAATAAKSAESDS